MPDWSRVFAQCLGRPPPPCQFCGDVTRENGFAIVRASTVGASRAQNGRLTERNRGADHESDLIAFHDRAPGARVHLLLIPAHHVPNVRYLEAEHVRLLERMATLGERLLDVMGVARAQQRLGFHIARASHVGLCPASADR